MIRLEALPAEDGDCLWMEWRHRGRRHRMLVDGGRGRVARRRLDSLPVADRRVELVVCTHIDADHIEGLIDLFAEPPNGFSVADVWFNGSRHLRPAVAGPRQGDRLGEVLGRSGVAWNRAFGREAVVVPDGGPLPVVRLPGLTLTLLGPDRKGLARLDAFWPEVIADELAPLQAAPYRRQPDPDDAATPAELAARPSAPDLSPANGASIAFLAEDEDGARVLFAADAPAEVLLRGLRRLAPAGGPVPVDLCKAPHHGSGHNVSVELVGAVDCGDWLFCTSGARHRHPDRRAVARVIVGARRPRLWFNYRGPTTQEYADPAVAARYGFTAVHPPADRPGLVLAISPGRVEPGAP